jgi:uncharacterized protein YjbI with pentapeptide repeats
MFKMITEEIVKNKFKLRNLDLSGSNLSGTDLSKAYLIFSNLSGSNLSNVNLNGANLIFANLSDVNLTGANLTGANLTGANLSNTNLTGANLTGADLSYVNLSNTNLTDVMGLSLPCRDRHKDILREVKNIILEDESKLDMSTWHNKCESTHCIAGWISYLVSVKDCVNYEMINNVNAFSIASHLIGHHFLNVNEKFHLENDDAIDWLKSLD